MRIDRVKQGRWIGMLGLLLFMGLPSLALAACEGAEARATPVTYQMGSPPSPVVKAELVTPPRVPSPITRKEAATVVVELEVVEKKGLLADGVEYEFWGYNGSVPGPFIRVRGGDTVEIRLKNAQGNKSTHSIDLHSVTGPGGGARVTQAAPGKELVFRWGALKPGLYVYHCASPVIPQHVANGLYGLILVEPQEGLPKVDREFYVMQGDFYTTGKVGEKGMQSFSMEKLLKETPEYVVFNGSTNSLTGANTLKARVGETVRIFFGAAGPNLVSSFHVIGEIFDTVYPEAAAEPVHSVQTTLVPPGGSTVVEFKLEVPGTYILVDHSLSRILKGAVGLLEVEGEPAPAIFQEVK